MPTFDTPAPIALTVDLRVGDVQIIASDRSDTVVEVRPSSDADKSDVEAAAQTQVELHGDRLSVIGFKPALLARLTSSASVDVVVSLPRSSSVQATLGLGDLRASGVLGDCSVKTGAGHIRLGDTGTLRARTGTGEVTVGRVAGNAEIDTASGATRLAAVSGNASVKTGHGVPELGAVGGDLRVRASNGDIIVRSVRGNLDARTAHGKLRIGRVERGEADLKTAHGDIEVGIAEGTRAWLDVDTGYGRVINELSTAPAPTEPRSTIRVTARTSFGEIRIVRALGHGAEATV